MTLIFSVSHCDLQISLPNIVNEAVGNWRRGLLQQINYTAFKEHCKEAEQNWQLYRQRYLLVFLYLHRLKHC